MPSPITIDTTMATPNNTNEKLSLWTPFPTSPILKDPKPHLEHQDDQWTNIKAIIAAIAVPAQRSLSSPTSSTSENTTLVDDNEAGDEALLLPKFVDSAPPLSPASNASAAYGTFAPSSPSAATVIPLHPSTSTLLTSAALTPIYLILLTLPLLPFWIFAGFLAYIAITSAVISPGIIVTLAVLVPFNVLGTVGVVRFALRERGRFADAGDLEAGLGSRRASEGSEKRRERLWRPSMRFVLQGSRA